MSQEPQTVSLNSAQHAAAAVDHARRLRQSAVVLRRLAGTMKYHPITGQRSEPSAALTDALDAAAQVLNEIQRGAAERAEEESFFDARGEAIATQIRAGHESLEQRAQVTAAAIEVLRTVLATQDGEALDAPYGGSAPRRHHPGALCTIVAERAESLALALETVAILKVNIPAGDR